MKNFPSRRITAGAVCLALGVFATSSFAQDEHGKDAEHGMDAAGMEEMMKLAAPGSHHSELASWVGTWKSDVKSYWMDPSQPVVSTGTAKYEMELGGRVLNGFHSGDFGGMPFEGHSIDGYDNAKGQYWSIWLDNMGTGCMISTGSASADGKTVTYTGSSFDPMSGKDVSFKMISHTIDANHRKFEMYSVEGSTETKQMEITYTRM